MRKARQEKNIREAGSRREQKTENKGVSFFHSCITSRSGMQAVKEIEEQKKERRETRNKQGLPFGLCFHFSTYKSVEQGRKKCRKSIKREREGLRLQR